MKKYIVLILLGMILYFESCSNQNNNSCPSTITSALGNYVSDVSLVDVSSSSSNTNTIYVQVSNSTSCDYIELKLTGAINTTIKAKFNSSIPYQGNYFTIPAGQTIQYSGMSFNISSSAGNSLFIKDKALNLNIASALTSTSTDYLNITLNAPKI